MATMRSYLATEENMLRRNQDKSPKLYEVIPKEEIADFEEVMRKTIADIVSEASNVACWVYVQKYVKQKTLDEMLQEWSGASQFIIVMDACFERLMADQQKS